MTIIEATQKTPIVYEDINSKESASVSDQRTKRKNKRKKKRKQASVVNTMSEKANESVPGQSNESIPSQVERKQPASSNENNVPAKKNHDTTLSLDETKSENTPAKNSSSNDKASAQKSNKTAKTKHRTIVCGDSMVKNVDSWKLKPKCHKNEEIVIKSFPGATVKDMRSYIEPSVDRKPDTIILHCGTNDLRFKDKTEVQISGEIIEVAKLIQSNEIDVIVSGLIARGDELEDKRKKTNYILRDMCFEESITYTDHPNIDASNHLNRSKLHLNRHGDSILTANILKASRL